MDTSIQELINTIRSQKGLLIGRRSAETLQAFLSGFAYARSGPAGNADYQFLSDFTDWVQKRYHVKSCQSWAQIIAFYCNEESEELPLFWKLYDQFLEKSRRNGRRSKPRREAV
jgi:hypothetical protein